MTTLIALYFVLPVVFTSAVTCTQRHLRGCRLMATKATPLGGDTMTLETISTEMWQPTNYFNIKCTMTEGSVDKIVSAIHLMMEGSSKNAGLDFAEIVRQFLCDLTLPEQRHFWIELKALHPQKWPNDVTAINSPDDATLTAPLDSMAAKAGNVQ